MKEIGKRLKELRTENRLSQQEFGALLSVSQDTISLWENGKSCPSVQHIIIISKTFNVSSDYLLGLSDY